MKRLLLGLCLFSVLFLFCYHSVDANSTYGFFTEKEEDWLLNHDPIIIGYSVDYAPLEFIDIRGKPSGIALNWFIGIADSYGIEYEFASYDKNTSWQDALNDMKEGNIDVLTDVTPTDERQDYIFFTDPYESFRLLLVGNSSQDYLMKISNIRQLDHEKNTFYVTEGHWQEEYLNSTLNRAEIIVAKNMKEAFKYINEGQGYMLIELPVYNYYEENYSYNHIKIIGELDEEIHHSIGVNFENETLAGILNKILKQHELTVFIQNDMIEKQNRNYYLERFIFAIVFIGLLVLIPLVRLYFLTVRKNRKLQFEKADFVSKVFHNLKTPIAASLGYMQLLKEHEYTEESLDYINATEIRLMEVKSTIEKLSLMTSYQNKIDHQLVVVKLHNIYLQALYDMETIAIDKNIQLINEVDEDVYDEVFGNGSQLYQLFELLIDNAIKYTGVNGIIRIGSRSVGKGHIQLYITDNGIGIPETDVKLIFNKYYKGSNHHLSNSTGLGLAIAKEIIDHHNAKIKTKSKVDEGTTITITFKTIR
ncbi:ATP-binding protein [Vallitalea okinawensis]|uniref:ATP-binding protein n=1 Tax=Vallitalea okinawensis TaxID=2078660 RepID=UPI000CFB9BF1|nr:transporter substrate-binding domain-containing protein [Vallitalea okinawensis]